MKNQSRHDTSILTLQRKAVWQAMLERQSDLTASEVYQAAQKLLSSISYATAANKKSWQIAGFFSRGVELTTRVS